jgi:hypothetical protein
MSNEDYKIEISCKDNKAYSPIGVQNLMAQAEKENNGNLQIVLDNKHKYKQLWELYHGNFLALALYKRYGIDYKFNICVPKIDPPDLFFIQENGNGAFPVEIMELYKYKKKFKDYKELAEHIWNTKGQVNYQSCYLLLASRLSAKKFNITEFIKELKNYNWKFQKIYLSLYTAEFSQWTFFEIFPFSEYNDSNYISFNLEKDKQYLY